MSTELKMIAYKIKGFSGSKEMKEIPLDFFKSIVNTPLAKRWIPEIDKEQDEESTHTNINNFEQLDNSICENNNIFYGQFLELTTKGSIRLTDYIDGSDSEIDVPDGKGTRKIWGFVMAPNSNLLVLEQKDRSAERKLAEYFNANSLQWNKNNKERIDKIEIQAIQKESNPIEWMRKNPNLGSFEARLNAGAINNQYGLLSPLLQGLTNELQDLKIKIEISSIGRGSQLPEVLVGNLENFIDNIDESGLYQSSVKQVTDGKRSPSRKLLNVLEVKTVELEKDNSNAKEKEFVDFILELIKNLCDKDDEC